MENGQRLGPKGSLLISSTVSAWAVKTGYIILSLWGPSGPAALALISNAAGAILICFGRSRSGGITPRPSNRPIKDPDTRIFTDIGI